MVADPTIVAAPARTAAAAPARMSPHAESVRARLGTPWGALHLVTGPAGTGKSFLLRGVLGSTPGTLHWEVPPLEEGGLLGDLDRLVAATLGELPEVERPELLPLSGSGAEWAKRFDGIFRALANAAAREGAPSGVFAVDGLSWLAGARRRLPEELLDAWRRASDLGVPVHLVVTSRERYPSGWSEAGDTGVLRAGPGAPAGTDPATRIHLGGHPFREAARAHGGSDAEDAFLRWAIFGDHPAHLPGSPPPENATLEDEIVRRVLLPGGDLHDAPLRRLEREVRAPQRYVGILAALAAGEDGWGRIAGEVGASAGNRIAPYLARLEEDGWIQVRTPLDGRPGGRMRRYALSDPFSSFWFGLVLPVRSLLHREDPKKLLRERILPGLHAHARRKLPELARRWVTTHGSERLPAPAREVGPLWGQGIEIPVAARLEGGQVCYGLVDPVPEHPVSDDARPPAAAQASSDVELLDRLEGMMREIRWGIGREARAPLLFLAREPSSELRRRAAGNPLLRILTLGDLMGEP